MAVRLPSACPRLQTIIARLRQAQVQARAGVCPSRRIIIAPPRSVHASAQRKIIGVQSLRPLLLQMQLASASARRQIIGVRPFQPMLAGTQGAWPRRRITGAHLLRHRWGSLVALRQRWQTTFVAPGCPRSLPHAHPRQKITGAARPPVGFAMQPALLRLLPPLHSMLL